MTTQTIAAKRLNKSTIEADGRQIYFTAPEFDYAMETEEIVYFKFSLMINNRQIDVQLDAHRNGTITLNSNSPMPLSNEYSFIVAIIFMLNQKEYLTNNDLYDALAHYLSVQAESLNLFLVQGLVEFSTDMQRYLSFNEVKTFLEK